MDTTTATRHVCDAGWIEVVEARRMHMPITKVPADSRDDMWECSIEGHGDDCRVALIRYPAASRCPVCNPRRSRIPTTTRRMPDGPAPLPYKDN